MAFSKVHSAQMVGLYPHMVDVEIDLSTGLHAFTIVGLPDKAVEESRDRVSSAIKNSGFRSPKARNHKIVASLAPADLKKEGPLFDVPIALAYLLAAGDVSFSPERKLFLGELSLDGTLRSIKGALPIVKKALAEGFEDVFLPASNAREAALLGDAVRIWGVQSLRELAAHLHGDSRTRLSPIPKTDVSDFIKSPPDDLSAIKGQETAKRGLEIAAAGGHNIILSGPPGAGKTMLARALVACLPPLSFDEMIEATSIHSVAGTLADGLIVHPPFRSPHHTASYVSLVGGGSFPRPGEITLAHRGVLFLDEFPEFDRKVLEALRQPLEEGAVSISRAKGSLLFPARFTLVAAMNLCPCGKQGIPGKECVCTAADLSRYSRRVSGPIADRIDMWIHVGPVAHKILHGKGAPGETARVRGCIARAQIIQRNRFKEAGKSLRTNAEMGPKELDALVPLETKVRGELEIAAERLGLSARAYHRVIKIARTIADLEGAAGVGLPHIREALSYRPKN